MLTTAQQATLKAAILADQTLAPLTSGPGTDYGAIAIAMNADASPAFKVWKTSLLRDEALGDGFDFTQVDNLTTGQARIFDWLFDNAAKSTNPSQASKRAAITEAWKGTAAKVAVATYIFSLCKRNANRVEKLFATGTGTDVSPGTMTYEGTITLTDVAALFNV